MYRHAIALILLCPLLLFSKSPWGKFDFGPAYVHIDVLESEHTVSKMDLYGSSIYFDMLVSGGWVVKPHFLYVKNDGNLVTFGSSVGHCFPLFEKWLIFPLIDVSVSRVKTKQKVYVPFSSPITLQQKFLSTSLAPGFEITYNICKDLRLCGHFHYAWSRTETDIEKIFSFISYCWGPTFSALLEYDFNQYCSINLGAAYNSSLSKDKHGLRGYGVKLGIALWLY